MAALETVSGFATAPGAGAALTMSGGTTLTIRDFKMGRAFIVDFWKNGQAANGFFRLTSPKMHDAVQGLRLQNRFGACERLYPWGFPQQVYPQDTLVGTISGSAVAGDIENVGFTVYYENPTTSQARLIGFDALEAGLNKTGNLFAATFALVGAGTGAFGAQQALSAAATGDLTKANTDYAILGISFSESAANNGAAVGIVGPDLGNYRVDVPTLQNDDWLCNNYFCELTRYYKTPLIPVVNSANKGGTFFDTLINENADTVTASVIMAQLQ